MKKITSHNMKFTLLLLALLPVPLSAAEIAPGAVETQAGRAMHLPMKDLPHVRVGVSDGDIRGSDNRALQAAMDLVASLGGGVLEIGPGDYVMRDSLHLRSHVIVKGTPGGTVLRKARAASSPLRLDGDYGEEQFTVTDPSGFEIGDGVAVWDKNAGGFHNTVARITGRNGNTFSISLPLNSDCMVQSGAQAATVFPVVSGYHLEGVHVQDLVIEGNRGENPYIDGCRGGGVFLYRCPGAVVERCTVRHYNGDGISFQQSNDARVLACTCEENSGLGLHPGSGSQRAQVRGCTVRNNTLDGLFLCWRVKQGVFEDNVLEHNGRYGISIGHKDTDNLIRNNTVRGNGEAGIFFRDEAEGMAGHRNRVVENVIENNGVDRKAPGIRVRGATRDLVFQKNVIRDTRASADRKQTVGIQIDSTVGAVSLVDNQITAERPVADDRKR
jgi:parallel beta-helix repeat protein